MRRERLPVARQRIGQVNQPGLRDSNQFLTLAVAEALQQTRRQQLDFKGVLVRPAGRAVHLAQALGMYPLQSNRAFSCHGQ